MWLPALIRSHKILKATFSRPDYKAITNDSPPLARLAFNVKRLRVSEKLTQRELGGKAGVSSLTIGRVEHADGNVKLSTLLKVINALRVSLMEMLKVNEELPGKSTQEESLETWLNWIAQSILNYRQKENLSLRQLAAKLDLAHLTLWRYEQESRDISLKGFFEGAWKDICVSS